MRYSIITPTLLRDTLPRLCWSIDEQSCGDWEHILAVDTLSVDENLLRSIRHPQRILVQCPSARRDWGNTCRRAAWEAACGEYLLYTDDDNYYVDKWVLETLKFATQPVVLFPLLHRGTVEPAEPIVVGRADSNALMVRREIGQWPAFTDHAADGMFIEQLTAEHPYQVFKDRALVAYEYGGRPPRRRMQQQ